MIRDWLEAERISSTQRAEFQAKVKALEIGGPDLSTGFLTATPIAKDIYKMKVRGPVQLRPMACKGPFNLATEFTILLGWIERDNQKVPQAVKTKAQQHRQIVIDDPTRRRREPLD